MNNSHEKKARRIATLLAGYMRDTLTPAEHDELDEWVGASDKNMRLFEELTDEKRVKLALEILNDNNDTGLVTKLNDDVEFLYPKRSFFRRIPNAMKVAATVVLVAGIGITVYLSANRNNNNIEKATSSPLTNVSEQPAKSDVIVPGGDKATLKTYNDEVFALNELKDGNVTEQGNTQVIKENDQIRYAVVNKDNSNITLINTLTTPRGGNFAVILSDGTKVWINSETILKYPAYFSENERRVTVTGEAYFEVAKQLLSNGDRKPFIVQTTGKKMSSIEVFGTHFNVKAYPDESIVKTTLLEGKVKIKTSKHELFLEPNQQSRVNADGAIQLLKDVNVKDVMWKDQVIKVEEGDLESTLHQIARWYDLELEIHKPANINLTSSYSGPLNLKNPLEEILKIFKNNTSTPHTSFDLTGRKLIVTVTPS